MRLLDCNRGLQLGLVRAADDWAQVWLDNGTNLGYTAPEFHAFDYWDSSGLRSRSSGAVSAGAGKLRSNWVSES